MLKLLELKAIDKVNRLKFALLFFDQDASVYYFGSEIIYLN